LSRFFISQIGQVEGVLEIKADKPHKALTDGGPKDRPHVMATELMKNEARVLARAAELVLAQFEGGTFCCQEAWSCARRCCNACRSMSSKALAMNSRLRSTRIL